MAEKTRNINRYRLSVPVADTSVNDWIANQDNLSFSLRCIIKEVVAKYGMTDVTCLSDFPQESPTAVVQESQPAKQLDTTPQFKSVSDVVSDAKELVQITPEPVAVPQPVEKKKPMLSQTPNVTPDMSDTLASLLK